MQQVRSGFSSFAELVPRLALLRMAVTRVWRHTV